MRFIDYSFHMGYLGDMMISGCAGSLYREARNPLSLHRHYQQHLRPAPPREQAIVLAPIKLGWPKICGAQAIVLAPAELCLVKICGA